MSAEPSAAAPHPALALDDTVHQRVRLGILAILSEVRECRFSALRDELQLTDGNLNRHLRVLEEAQLLQVRKGYEGRRPCTWLRLTRQGKDALRTELATLEQLVSRLRQDTKDTEDTSADAGRRTAPSAELDQSLPPRGRGTRSGDSGRSS